MSYNLTADRLMVHNAVHLQKDDPCYNPDYRLRRIMAEIESSCPDILCLQEVSVKTAYPFVIQELENMGYQVIECKQTEAQVKEGQ